MKKAMTSLRQGRIVRAIVVDDVDWDMAEAVLSQRGYEKIGYHNWVKNHGKRSRFHAYIVGKTIELHLDKTHYGKKTGLPYHRAQTDGCETEAMLIGIAVMRKGMKPLTGKQRRFLGLRNESLSYMEIKRALELLKLKDLEI